MPDFTEDALALRFAECHGDELRYVAAWGQWLIWKGTHWEPEKTLRVFDLARKVCRAAAGLCSKPAVSSGLRKARTVTAVEMLARSDRKHAATIDQWDADQWLLNTPGGIVDLRTGETRPARADDYCTKITAVARGASCPRWQEFLTEVTDCDADLMDYLQRVFGYALTGDTREQALFFFYGRRERKERLS